MPRSECKHCGRNLDDTPQGNPCPDCGKSGRHIYVDVEPARLRITAGTPTVTITHLWERLLQTAEFMFRESHYSSAVIIAQSACEVIVERSIKKAFEDKCIPELVGPIDALFLSYSPRNPKVLNLYNALTGDAP